VNIGSRIAGWREAKKLTQQQLADEIGVTRAAVYQWELGQTVPSTRHVEKVAEICGVTMERFYGRVPKRAA
jgi:transcriptional regulator with XRE-family HTH domain